jgi:hypothetical protein
MNLYRITWATRFEGRSEYDPAYGTYESAIVAAPDEETARSIHPKGYWWDEVTMTEKPLIDWAKVDKEWDTSWAIKPKDVEVELIGTADPKIELGVVLASYNAG